MSDQQFCLKLHEADVAETYRFLLWPELLVPIATYTLILPAICLLAKMHEILPRYVCMHKSVSWEVGHCLSVPYSSPHH